MFENAVPLDYKKHKNLRYVEEHPYFFAAKENLIPVVSGEIMMVAREYPVVFPVSRSGLPLAVTGPEKGVNLHVRESGHWVGRYVPAHIRRYPFIAASKKNSTEYVVMIDPDAPHLGADTGEPLYNDDGKSSPVLERVIKALRSLKHDEDKTAKMLKQLDHAGLLISQKAQAGYLIVDAETLFKLDGSKLAELNSTGALMLAYAHLMSLTNLRDGMLAKKPQEKAPAEVNLDDFFKGDDRLFRFDA